METLTLLPHLHVFRFAVGQAFLWTDGEALTLIDSGLPGSAGAITEGIERLGYDPGRLDRIVLTHFHGDHTGSAADLRKATGAPTLAHHLDAAFVRGDGPAPDAVMLDWEKPIRERAAALGGTLTGPPCEVDQELTEGDVLDFGGGARVIGVPGHTAGSIALHLPGHDLVFTGDAVAEYEGEVILGVFNQDRAEAIRSLRKIADLGAASVCFGHGDAALGDAATRLRAAAAAAE